MTLTGMPAVAHDAEGRRAWRAVRHDGDQGGASRRAARARRATSCWCPDSAHGTNPATAALHRLPVEPVPARDGRHGASGGGEGSSRPRCRRDHAHQPQHLRPVRARGRRDRRGGARGRRLLLLRRRQLQRHRRQGAAGRSRRRRHAHQPAQDLLDAAWRRRAGRRPGGAVGGARALRAGAVRARATTTASSWWSRRPMPAREALRPHDAPSTARWACSCARWPTCSRMAPTACGRRPRTPCSTPTTSAPASPT